MNIFEKVTHGVAKSFYWMAGVSIMMMMLLTCADVVLRFLNYPILGVYEIVCFLSVLVISFAMAYTAETKGHVAVTLIIELLPKKQQGVVEIIGTCISFVFFVLLAWRAVVYAEDLRELKEVSLTLQLPFFPIVYGIGISAAAVCLVLLIDLNKSLREVFNK